MIGLLAFDIQMNSFSPSERLPNSRSSKLIESAEVTNSCILPTDQGLQLWRFFATKSYKTLSESQKYMESVACELVEEKLNCLDLDSKRNATHKSLLEEYLNNPNLEKRDVIGMACDLLLAGVDTVNG